jgi:hypothetical protein
MIKTISDFIVGLLTILSVLSISSFIFRWIANQWLPYFQWPEITYWQSFALFLFGVMVLYFKIVLTNYFNK